jgi:hypothetical protein
MKSTQEKQPLYWSQKSRKFIRSPKLEEEKLGTKVIAQSKRALKKEDFS